MNKKNAYKHTVSNTIFSLYTKYRVWLKKQNNNSKLKTDVKWNKKCLCLWGKHITTHNKSGKEIILDIILLGYLFVLFRTLSTSFFFFFSLYFLLLLLFIFEMLLWSCLAPCLPLCRVFFLFFFCNIRNLLLYSVYYLSLSFCFIWLWFLL